MAMKKTAEKRQYYLHLVEIQDVPSGSGDYLLKWKRGDKDINKGVLKGLKCNGGSIQGNTFNVIMATCTLFHNSKGYDEKLMKFTLVHLTDGGKKKKEEIVGIGYIDLATYVACVAKRTVSFDLKTKKGEKFPCQVSVQSLGGLEVSDNDKTEVYTKAKDQFDETEAETQDDDTKSKSSVKSKTEGKSPNPFGDDEDDDRQKSPRVNVTTKVATSQSRKSDNPFGDTDDEEEEQVTNKSGAKKENPFGDSDDEEDKKQQQRASKGNAITTQTVGNPFGDSSEEEKETKKKSDNPFGDSDDDEEALKSTQTSKSQTKVVSNVQVTHSQKKSGNPFGVDSDDEDTKPTQVQTKETKPLANPFGDDSEEDVPVQKQPHRPSKGNANSFETSKTNTKTKTTTVTLDTSVTKKNIPQPTTQQTKESDKSSKTSSKSSKKSVSRDGTPRAVKKADVLVGYTKTNDGDKLSSPVKETNIFKPTQSLEDVVLSQKVTESVQFKDTGIDIREVIDSFSTKGHLDDLDSFVILLKKWWADGKSHAELDIIPMVLETIDDCVWAIMAIKEVGGKLQKTTRKGGREEQIDLIYERIYIKAVKICSFKMEGLLDYLVDSPSFDSQKSTYEEGVANGIVEMVNQFYEKANKLSDNVAERLTTQIIHFICYYIIEELISRDKIQGMKGFQMSYLVSCMVNRVCINNKYICLKKYMIGFDPLTELCRLITMPLTLDIVKMKEQVYPTLPYEYAMRALNKFKLDDFNLSRIKTDVKDYLFENGSGEVPTSRFTILP
ncbi:hypothetical protein EIN_096970 [Entamoeba invadens IP1]|uniref:C2 NT-type domain-containing protein n=1 Tax=Entamoeba invadens IP1 TaxID=370355 RepID=A0A0A1U0L0_ENTIV|nr:hypothetical protein EIN_096970 [Entamoeba invadens IP1]ELP87430.1 hypothetical protein EIN_096970 [Entamoeba invadens IP1]|eukprot:XP_004254201.1 hypothetical protein EIN_096970 [Entamoeba invadens IP1]